MTNTANARTAGVLYLLYVVVGIGSMSLGDSELANATMAFCALGLGVTLYGLTRAIDHELATMAMACRFLEAAPGSTGEIYFAMGSTIFSWLLLRGRLIPAALAWLGVVSSAALLAHLALVAAGFFGGRTNWASPLTWSVWLPMLIFELALAAWLIAKGVRTQQH
ncbi:MAG TPA: DUF4386 family protein [Vicinamibacterales bacterium]|nr:DUF4386 family protein [Vicinamibacterales bacterium]